MVAELPKSPGGSSGPDTAGSDSDSGISENGVDSEDPTSRRSTKNKLNIRVPEFIRSGQLTEALLSCRRNHDLAESSDGTPTPSRGSTPTPPVWRGRQWTGVAIPSRCSSPATSTRGSCFADLDSCSSTPAPSVVGGDFGSDSCCSMPAGDMNVSVSKKKRSRRRVGWGRQRRSRKRPAVSKCDLDIPFASYASDKAVSEAPKTSQGDGRRGEGDNDAKDNCVRVDGTAQETPQSKDDVQQNVDHISAESSVLENRSCDGDETNDVERISNKRGNGQMCVDVVKTELPEAGVNSNCVNGYISDRSTLVCVVGKTACKTETVDDGFAFIESGGDETGRLKVDRCDVIGTEAEVSGDETLKLLSEVKLETNSQCDGVPFQDDKSKIKIETVTQFDAGELKPALVQNDTGNLVAAKSEDTTIKIEKCDDTPAPDETGKADQETMSAADVKEESDEEMEEVVCVLCFQS